MLRKGTYRNHQRKYQEGSFIMLTKKEKEIAKKSKDLSIAMYIIFLILANIYQFYTRNTDTDIYPWNVFGFLVNTLFWLCLLNAISYNLIAELVVRKFTLKK